MASRRVAIKPYYPATKYSPRAPTWPALRERARSQTRPRRRSMLSDGERYFYLRPTMYDPAFDGYSVALKKDEKSDEGTSRARRKKRETRGDGKKTRQTPTRTPATRGTGAKKREPEGQRDKKEGDHHDDQQQDGEPNKKNSTTGRPQRDLTPKNPQEETDRDRQKKNDKEKRDHSPAGAAPLEHPD